MLYNRYRYHNISVNSTIPYANYVTLPIFFKSSLYGNDAVALIKEL
jgi:hypothetical protein